jgi:hypothetical protein
MTSVTTVRVFVNARGHDVPAGASALDAVRIADPAGADDVAAGTRLITDSRGIVVPPETPAYGGVIYRLVANRVRDLDGSA